MEHSTGSCVLMNFQQGLFLSSSLRKRSLVVTKSAKRGSTLSSSAAPVALTALSFSGVSRAATCSAASGQPRASCCNQAGWMTSITVVVGGGSGLTRDLGGCA